jgi:hypothetical protein
MLQCAGQLTHGWLVELLLPLRFCGSDAYRPVFIAVPLASALIRKNKLPVVNVFLSPLCFHFLHVFFLCGMVAVPRANPLLTGVAAIVSALWRLAGMPRHFSVLRIERKNPQAEVHPSDWLPSCGSPHNHLYIVDCRRHRLLIRKVVGRSHVGRQLHCASAGCRTRCMEYPCYDRDNTFKGE